MEMLAKILGVAVLLLFGAGLGILCTKNCSDQILTSDGILGFLGSLFCGITSIFVALIALYQSRKSIEAEEKLEDEKRRNKIRPFLQIELERIDEELLKIKTTNHTTNAALNVYLFEYPLFCAVTSSKPQAKAISFSHKKDNCLYVDKEWVKLCDDGLPKEVDLFFLDVDNNTLHQKFQRDGQNSYNPCEIDYY